MTPPDIETETTARWAEWLERGRVSDARSRVQALWVMCLVAAGIASWSVWVIRSGQ